MRFGRALEDGAGDSSGRAKRTSPPRPSNATAVAVGPAVSAQRRQLSWTREGVAAQTREDAEVLERSEVAIARLGPSSADLRTDGCIPGCFRKGKQCRDVGRAHDAYSCSFPPEQLQYALEAQQVSWRAQGGSETVGIDLAVWGPIECSPPLPLSPSPHHDHTMAYRVRQLCDGHRAGRRRLHLQYPVTP